MTDVDPSEVVVIGVGNPDRGDDGAGRLVARRLAATLAGHARIVEQTGDASALVGALEGARLAVVVDACASGASVGTVARFDVSDAAVPARAIGLSSHALGVGEGLELARALGALPKRCIAYAIEGGNFAPGAPMSAAVVAAVEHVVARVRSDIEAAWEGRCTRRH